jgi:hypothetical protein
MTKSCTRFSANRAEVLKAETERWPVLIKTRYVFGALGSGLAIFLRLFLLFLRVGLL